MDQMLLVYGHPKDTVKAIIMVYINIKAMFRSPDGDTDFFEFISGVLQGDTLT